MEWVGPHIKGKILLKYSQVDQKAIHIDQWHLCKRPRYSGDPGPKIPSLLSDE